MAIVFLSCLNRLLFPKVRQAATSWFSVAVAIATICSLLGYLGQLHWLLDLTSHFKLQYFIISLVTLIFFGLIRRKSWHNKIFIVSLLCFFINFWEVAVWYLPPPVTATQNDRVLTVLLANVLAGNQNYAQLTSLMRDLKPDVAVLQEVDDVWQEELKVVENLLPYRASVPRKDNFGIALYSSFPLQQVEKKVFAANIPSLLADISIAETTVKIVATHPLPPINAEYSRKRDRQLQAVGEYLSQLNSPTILIGDLNITQWSPHYRQLIKTTKLQDSRRGFGILPTWPVQFPLLYIPIDRCLVSREFQVLQTDTGNKIGSDHLPLIVRLALTMR